MKFAKAALIIFAVMLAITSMATASTITATEILEWTTLQSGGTGVQRTWSESGAGTTLSPNPTISQNQTTIQTQNKNTDSDSFTFGANSTNPTYYAHTLTWLAPTPDNYASATLTIWGIAAANGNGQDVYVDTVDLGEFNKTSTPNFLVNFSGLQISTFLADDLLNIRVQPQSGKTVQITKSELDVTYNYEGTAPVGPVPEPASLLLLGTGLFGLGIAAIRRHK